MNDHREGVEHMNTPNEPKSLTDALRRALEVARLEQVLDPAARLEVTLPQGRYWFACGTPGPISLVEAIAAAWPEQAGTA